MLTGERPLRRGASRCDATARQPADCGSPALSNGPAVQRGGSPPRNETPCCSGQRGGGCGASQNLELLRLSTPRSAQWARRCAPLSPQTPPTSSCRAARVCVYSKISVCMHMHMHMHMHMRVHVCMRTGRTAPGRGFHRWRQDGGGQAEARLAARPRLQVRWSAQRFLKFKSYSPCGQTLERENWLPHQRLLSFACLA